MGIDYALILAAGHGTRMGKIGKELPKLLWPIFSQTLLELQVSYVKSWGVNEIFVNLHHQYDVMKDYLDSHSWANGIHFLYEPQLLDIGGGIHNVARQVGYKGNLLIINGDQFYFFRPSDSTFWEQKEDAVSLLLPIEVKRGKGYNGLDISHDFQLKAIIPEQQIQKKESYLTYSGVSLIDLSELKPQEGPSSFFATVANFQVQKVKVAQIAEGEYWDFGTKERYSQSMWRLLQDNIKLKESSFLRFCRDQGVIDLSQVDSQNLSYGSTDCSRTINLSPSFVHHKWDHPLIVLEGPANFDIKADIYYKSLYDDI